jgi:hypothetical protein
VTQTEPSLQTLSSRAGRALLEAGAPQQAGNDLAWAWLHLGAADLGRTIVRRLSAGEMDQQLEAIYGQPWEVLEVAAMSLGFGDVMTAIDLCADAVLLACGAPLHATGRFYDLGNLRRRRGELTTRPALEAWANQLLAHPDDLTLLEECRHHLIHRHVRRHIGVTMGNAEPTRRALAEITTLHGSDPPRSRGSIADLVPRMVTFGEEQLKALCSAILNP